MPIRPAPLDKGRKVPGGSLIGTGPLLSIGAQIPSQKCASEPREYYSDRRLFLWIEVNLSLVAAGRTDLDEGPLPVSIRRVGAFLASESYPPTLRRSAKVGERALEPYDKVVRHAINRTAIGAQGPKVARARGQA